MSFANSDRLCVASDLIRSGRKAAVYNGKHRQPVRGPLMKNQVTLSMVVVMFVIGGAVAQTPYAGMQARSIKALSDQQIADLRAGRGMGLALAAELNGYPGPSHVLELADKLDLSSDQRVQIQRLFDSMKAEAVPLGSKLIEQESNLDRQFATHAITPEI